MMLRVKSSFCVPLPVVLKMAASVRTLSGVGLLSKAVRTLSLKAAVPRCVSTTSPCPASSRHRINVTPATFLSTANVSTSHSSPITVTDEPDMLYQKLTVLVKGHDKTVLDSYEFFATLAAQELGLSLTKVFEPPRNIERLTLLKSVHIFKKHRVQYEMRTHYRAIEIDRITGSTARAYLEYIQRNLPEGVAMEVTKTAIEKVPEHIQTPIWDKESQQETS
ncbi:small ribosomal subunit protein uS10m [Clarias gariepinus]|uniref:probable 28S ribosomal protein S10, mitochondrial n=1 Tax=Clarias gariepinus TaxID=13013 RepID=UPI00234C173F|nr:probable 28S ribosomal protein S10, mitochondrial [Clarias gariepinus]